MLLKVGSCSSNCSLPEAIMEDDSPLPHGGGGSWPLAWSHVELQAESLPRTVAELPLLDPSPRGWALKALKAGKEMLCPLPGQLPQDGGPLHSSKGRHLGSGQNKGWGQQSGDFRRP